MKAIHACKLLVYSQLNRQGKIRFYSLHVGDHGAYLVLAGHDDEMRAKSSSKL